MVINETYPETDVCQLVIRYGGPRHERRWIDASAFGPRFDNWPSTDDSQDRRFQNPTQKPQNGSFQSGIRSVLKVYTLPQICRRYVKSPVG